MIESRERAWKLPQARKGDTRREESRVSPFLAWGNFHARSRFARSTIPEEKRGLLVVWKVDHVINNCKAIWWLAGPSSAVQCILFNFSNYSPPIAMELKVLKQRNYMEMTKSEIRDKQMCLLSIIFEAASSRDQLWKTVRLNTFQKP